MFQYSEGEKFEAILPPLLDMLQRSPSFNLALGRSALFVNELTLRLRYPKALVQKKLLQMLRAIYNGKRSLSSVSMTRGDGDGGHGSRWTRGWAGAREESQWHGQTLPAWLRDDGSRSRELRAARAMRAERRRMVTSMGLFPLVRELAGEGAKGRMGFVLVMEVASMLLRDMQRDFVEP